MSFGEFQLHIFKDEGKEICRIAYFHGKQVSHL